MSRGCVRDMCMWVPGCTVSRCPAGRSCTCPAGRGTWAGHTWPGSAATGSSPCGDLEQTHVAYSRRFVSHCITFRLKLSSGPMRSWLQPLVRLPNERPCGPVISKNNIHKIFQMLIPLQNRSWVFFRY